MKRIDEIFDIKYGTDSELINFEEDINGIPFISRTSNNNGMVTKVKKRNDLEPMPGHAISVALGGSVLSSFYQKDPFYTSFHIFCLYPKHELNEIEMIYYCLIIEENKFRFNYGRQANKTFKSLLVPTPDTLPNNLKDFNTKIPFKKASLNKKEFDLKQVKWKDFRLDHLFEIYTSKDKNLTETTGIGETPYISSSQYNNGISRFINEEPTHPPNTLTVARNGSVGSSFYQPVGYCASPDDVRIFKPKYYFNIYIGLFICVLIEKEKFKFAYGRKFGTNRMKETKILLPIDITEQPDWVFIENYMKSLDYASEL